MPGVSRMQAGKPLLQMEPEMRIELTTYAI